MKRKQTPQSKNINKSAGGAMRKTHVTKQNDVQQRRRRDEKNKRHKTKKIAKAQGGAMTRKSHHKAKKYTIAQDGAYENVTTSTYEIL